jgi:branched-chain amino acid transport system substrate-binding protein
VRGILLAALLLAPTMALAQGAPKLKIGIITTLSSPAATAGPELVDGFKLGIKDSGDALGGRPVDLVIGDDQLKPDVAVQLARKMMDEDKVEIITGIIPSNIALAVAHAVLPRGKFLLSLNAGPSQLAGAECNPDFFSVSYQNDTAAEAMGRYVEQQGKKRVALIAANYAAGRDMTTGFKRGFKGEIVREIYTPLTQFDFTAELAEIRSLKPDAVFYFEQSGSPSINLVRQYAELGLKSEMPLYGVTFVLDESSLPGMGEAAIGIQSASYWSAALDNPASKRFVEHFRAAYHREPTIFAATAYDGARLIDGAVRKAEGHVDHADAFRQALAAAPFQSVRGQFRFNTNHYPVQSFYLAEVGRDSQGNITNLYKGIIVKDLADSYVGDCKMK